jgi:eukaryotic-like serine/threonine-protein kinase
MSHKLARNYCKPQVGQHFGCGGKTYELKGNIGDGAVGIVRKALPLEGGPLIAIKFLAPDPKYIDETVFEDVAARFKREGERGLHLSHDNLIRILGYEENSDGRAFRNRSPRNPFLIMEYISGKTLESYIKNIPVAERGSFLLDRPRLSIAIQICQALEYLKNHRLIHRDVKPANIFLKPSSRPPLWHAKLGDFGVVKWGDFHSTVSTGTFTVSSQKGLGTLKYMSPEQAIRPKAVTIKSDIWSLGITLFELFTGQILASAHHIYELQAARRTKGTTLSRFTDIGCGLPSGNAAIAERVLDMFLAPDGRPPINEIRGWLETTYERLVGREWTTDN